MLKLGSFESESRVIVAPMAGVTDLPFRNLCRSLGAFWLVSEMITSRSELWGTSKSRGRLPDQNESEPRWVQIVGAEPNDMAEAAKMNVALGAQIIDINMGCPAKKVCRKLAGSALLRDERLVAEILNAVVSAVDVPVTLKIRRGWSPEQTNAVTIAKIAEDAGIQLLTVHGRTRACKFAGEVNYEAIGEVKQAVGIPVIANGDITSAPQAKSLMDEFGFDGVMLGRGVQGKPWLAAQVDAYLAGKSIPQAPSAEALKVLLTSHLMSLVNFYGESRAILIARKHLGWYLAQVKAGRQLSRQFNQLYSLESQIKCIESWNLGLAMGDKREAA